MKFGETLYQRSVPKWAAYNVNYNEIKRLIKNRTTTGTSTPISIPGSGKNKWTDLENDLLRVLTEQYDNVGLFLSSKNGEINRRLSHLEKQLKAAKRSVAYSNSRQELQARKYHKLLQEAEAIGEDIQALSRFTSVQKTAFRKLLKKYRKWTNSTGLQTRLETEVFVTNKLDPDFAKQLEWLSEQIRLITEELQGPMLRGDSNNTHARPGSSQAAYDSSVTDINNASQQGAVHLDAALASVPYGVSAGSAIYWLHPDNLIEAQVLLLRHVQELNKNAAIPFPRQTSMLSVDSQASSLHSSQTSSLGDTHIVYYDNARRFVQDPTTSRSARVALSARWDNGSEAAVTLSNLSHKGSHCEVVRIKRKDLASTLSGTRPSRILSTRSSDSMSNISKVQDYLLEHRDVKPLAELHSCRSRYRALSESSKVGTWATLDTNIVISTCNTEDLGSVYVDVESGQAFPHAVLEIRWEFGHVPEVVRVFDSSHLAERVRDFSLESAAIYTTQHDLGQPIWKTLLEKDIRKIPITSRVSNAGRRGRLTPSSHVSIAGTASGTSSTDGPSDSLFSTVPGQSSATSEADTSNSIKDPVSPKLSKPKSAINGRMKKKRARVDAQSPQRRPQRYWNEFDDGDSDVNTDEGYAIYIDPNETFPGTETVTKAYNTMRGTMTKARSKIVSWLPSSAKAAGKKPDERTRLLITADLDNESSDSDSSPTASLRELYPSHGSKSRKSSRLKRETGSKYRSRQQLTPRQMRLENTYFLFYTGLLVLSYILLFISTILLNTGRKKVRLEVDAGVTTGILTAETCAVASLVLIYMRKMVLGVVHWGTVIVAAVVVIVTGIGLMVTAISQATNLSEIPTGSF